MPLDESVLTLLEAGAAERERESNAPSRKTLGEHLAWIVAMFSMRATTAWGGSLMANKGLSAGRTSRRKSSGVMRLAM